MKIILNLSSYELEKNIMMQAHMTIYVMRETGQYSKIKKIGI